MKPAVGQSDWSEQRDQRRRASPLAPTLSVRDGAERLARGDDCGAIRLINLQRQPYTAGFDDQFARPCHHDAQPVAQHTALSASASVWTIGTDD